MFSFLGFRPSCPLQLKERAWIESQMAWLLEKLGRDRLRSAQVTIPGSESFPLEETYSPSDAEALLHRLARELGVTREVSLEIVPDEQVVSAVTNTEATEKLVFRESLLSDGQRLAAAMIHDLAGIVLVGELCDEDQYDLPILADLYAVFVGLGLFGANACFVEGYRNWAALQFEWSMSKLGSLNSMQFGYALALFCWLRDETGDAWKGLLRRDAREYFDQGLKFLPRSDAHLFFERKPSHLDLPAYWEGVLSGKHDALILASLWDMAEFHEPLPPVLIDPLSRILAHSEVSIVSAALQVLQAHPELAERLQADVFECLTHSETTVQRSALEILPELNHTDTMTHAVLHCLDYTNDTHIKLECINFLVEKQEFEYEDRLTESLLPMLKAALLKQNDQQVVACVNLLIHLRDDAESIIWEHFEGDVEWSDLLSEAIELCRNPAT